MKSIEGLTIEELEALHAAVSIAWHKGEMEERLMFGSTWIGLSVDIQQQIKDQTFEQERKDNLPIER